MKIFTFLFSLYMLVLACLPCADREECNAASVAKTTASTNQQSHTHDAENCTPFCICNCCGMHIMQADVSIVPTTQIPHLSDRQKIAVYHQQISTRACHNIWQPPRLG